MGFSSKSPVQFGRGFFSLSDIRDNPVMTFIRFCMVGLVGYGLSLVTITSLSHVGLPHAAAFAPAWLLAATWTYLANRGFTFKQTHAPNIREWGAWLVTQAGGGIVCWGVYLLALTLSLPSALALAVSSLTGALFNFALGGKSLHIRWR